MSEIPGTSGQVWLRGTGVMTALDDLGQAAERAAPVWAGHLTIRQGYDITVTLGSVLARLGAVADDLLRYRLTGPADLAADSAAKAVSEIGESSRQIKNGQAALIIPDTELTRASIRHPQSPGGDPSRDGPGVAAAHVMLRAAGTAASLSRDLSGTTEDRDEVVIHLMSALDGLGLAVPNLGRDAPDPPFRTALTQTAACLDQAFSHLREYLIYSAAAATHLDTEELAQNMRRGILLRSERSHGYGMTADDDAAGLTAASFPGSPAGMAPGAFRPAISAESFPATWHPAHGRHARPPRGKR